MIGRNTLAKRGKAIEPTKWEYHLCYNSLVCGSQDIESKHLSLTPGTSWFILFPSWPAYFYHSSAISSGQLEMVDWWVMD